MPASPSSPPEAAAAAFQGTEYDLRAPHEGMSPGRYLATRIPTLRPPMLQLPNPLKQLAIITGKQWQFFFIAFMAWTMGTLDDFLLFS